MAKGQDFSGELLHFGAVRYRITGSGNLLTTLRSLDDITNEECKPDITLVTGTNREPTTLSLFVEQRAQVEFKVTEIDEYFNLSKIIVFVKPTASGYPQ